MIQFFKRKPKSLKVTFELPPEAVIRMKEKILHPDILINQKVSDQMLYTVLVDIMSNGVKQILN